MARLYEILTWDIDDAAYTPEEGVPQIVDGFGGLRAVLRTLERNGYAARRPDPWVLDDRRAAACRQEGTDMRFIGTIRGPYDEALPPVEEWYSIDADRAKDAAVLLVNDTTRPAGLSIPWLNGSFWVFIALEDGPRHESGMPRSTFGFRFSKANTDDVPEVAELQPITLSHVGQKTGINWDEVRRQHEEQEAGSKQARPGRSGICPICKRHIHENAFTGSAGNMRRHLAAHDRKEGDDNGTP